MAIIVQLLEGCKEINDKLNTVLKLGVSEERASFNKEDLMRHKKEVLADNILACISCLTSSVAAMKKSVEYIERLKAKSSHQNSEDEEGLRSNRGSRRASISPQDGMPKADPCTFLTSPIITLQHQVTLQHQEKFKIRSHIEKIQEIDTALIENIAKSHADNDKETTERSEKKDMLVKTKSGTDIVERNKAVKTKAKKDWSNTKKKLLKKTSSNKTSSNDEVSVRTMSEKSNRSISSRTDVSERCSKKSERPASPFGKANKDKAVKDQETKETNPISICAKEKGSKVKEVSEKYSPTERDYGKCYSERAPVSSDISWKKGETKLKRENKKATLSAEMIKELQKGSGGDDNKQSNLIMFELQGLEDVNKVMRIIGVHEGDVMMKKVIGTQGGVKRPIKVTLKSQKVLEFALSFVHKLEDDSRYSEVHFSDLSKDRTKEEQREHRRLIDQSRKNSILSGEASDEISKLRDDASQRDMWQNRKRRTSTCW